MAATAMDRHCDYLLALAQLRWGEGFECSQCCSEQYYLIRARNLRQCVNCRAQVSITAGTLMEATRLPVAIWFHAVHLLINVRCNGLTVNEFGRRLNLRYKTAWLLKYKIEQGLKSESQRSLLLKIAEFTEQAVHSDSAPDDALSKIQSCYAIRLT